MKSLFNIIQIYLENPSDKDMERVLERESTKNNTIKMYKKIKSLERQLAEARDMLLQVQDHMHQISVHTSDGWAGSSADDVYNMIEEQLKEKGE